MLILASASPRRSELLKKLVPQFKIVPSEFVEKAEDDESPVDYAVRCAIGKANEVFSRFCDSAETDCSKGFIVLGADTVVFAGGKILGKPKDMRQAKEMLNIVCGSKHSVVTGICLIISCGGGSDNEKISVSKRTTTAFERTTLLIDKLSDKEIKEYLTSGLPMDKAGAYGIQDSVISGKLKYIAGSMDNVIGLPTELLSRILPREKVIPAN